MASKNLKKVQVWNLDPGDDAAPYDFARAFIFGNYGDDLAHYLELVTEAKRDFPELKDSQITVGKVTKSSFMQHFILITFLIENFDEDEVTGKGYGIAKSFNFNW